jgi:hypothetical protein
MQKDGLRHTTKPIVTFRNFANAPKNISPMELVAVSPVHPRPLYPEEEGITTHRSVRNSSMKERTSHPLRI